MAIRDAMRTFSGSLLILICVTNNCNTQLSRGKRKRAATISTVLQQTAPYARIILFYYGIPPHADSRTTVQRVILITSKFSDISNECIFNTGGGMTCRCTNANIAMIGKRQFYEWIFFPLNFFFTVVINNNNNKKKNYIDFIKCFEV